jgi:hypothetical protein
VNAIYRALASDVKRIDKHAAFARP